MEASGEPGNPANQAVQPQPPQPASGAQAGSEAYAGQPSGGALFKLKCIWLFLLGAILSIIGLYCLLYRPDIGQNSFIIMLMGLFFTAAGSVYGKRKLRGQAAVANYVVDPQQMLQVIPQPSPPSQPAAAQVAPGQTGPAQPSGQPAAAAQIPGQPAEPKAAEIKKIFVCPKCGAENEMEDKFCYKCGNRFVKPKKKAAKKPARKAKQAKAKAGEKETATVIVKAGKQAQKAPKPAGPKRKASKEEF